VPDVERRQLLLALVGHAYAKTGFQQLLELAFGERLRLVGDDDDLLDRVREVAQQQQEAPYRAHLRRHADDAEAHRGLPVRRAAHRGAPLQQRVDVGERLRRVLVAAVTAADDRDAQGLRHLVHRVRVAVAQDDEIAVVVQHLADVAQALAFRDAGRGRVGDRHDVTAQAVPRGLERQPRARGWLVEGADQDLPGEGPRG